MHILGKVLGPEAPEYIRADMIYAMYVPMTPETRLEVAEDDIEKMEYFYGAKHPDVTRALNKYFKVLSDRAIQKN